MAKWVVLKLLSPRSGPLIQPGEIVELSDADAAPLLRRDAIAPAERPTEAEIKTRRTIRAKEQ